MTQFLLWISKSRTSISELKVLLFSLWCHFRDTWGRQCNLTWHHWGVNYANLQFSRKLNYIQVACLCRVIYMVIMAHLNGPIVRKSYRNLRQEYCMRPRFLKQKLLFISLCVWKGCMPVKQFFFAKISSPGGYCLIWVQPSFPPKRAHPAVGKSGLLQTPYSRSYNEGAYNMFLRRNLCIHLF